MPTQTPCSPSGAGKMAETEFVIRRPDGHSYRGTHGPAEWHETSETRGAQTCSLP